MYLFKTRFFHLSSIQIQLASKANKLIYFRNVVSQKKIDGPVDYSSAFELFLNYFVSRRGKFNQTETNLKLININLYILVFFFCQIGIKMDQ